MKVLSAIAAPILATARWLRTEEREAVNDILGDFYSLRDRLEASARRADLEVQKIEQEVAEKLSVKHFFEAEQNLAHNVIDNIERLVGVKQ